MTGAKQMMRCPKLGTCPHKPCPVGHGDSHEYTLTCDIGNLFTCPKCVPVVPTPAEVQQSIKKNWTETKASALAAYSFEEIEAAYIALLAKRPGSRSDKAKIRDGMLDYLRVLGFVQYFFDGKDLRDNGLVAVDISENPGRLQCESCGKTIPVEDEYLSDDAPTLCRACQPFPSKEVKK